MGTIISVWYEWDEGKRLENLKRHGLDFIDAPLVYEHPTKMTVESRRTGEDRKVDIAPLKGDLLVAYSGVCGARTCRANYQLQTYKQKGKETI